MKKIKVLTVSNTVWSDDNSFGMTYNSLFEGSEDCFEFANIYCNYGVPKNSCVKKYCQITEKTIIEHIKKGNSKCRVFDAESVYSASDVLKKREAKRHRELKKHRLQISMWARDFVWKKGLKDTSDIVNFVKEFNPDIIFTPMYYMFHTNKLLQTVIKSADVPVIAYISDDIYRMKKFPCSPLYSVDRILKRKVIRKSIELCDMLYVVCEEQKDAYEKEFGKSCKVLRKPAERISDIVGTAVSEGYRKSFIYAGNLGTERWKTIAVLGKIIYENGGTLKIYSATPVTGKIKKLFIKSGVDYRGYVPAEEAAEECQKADVLVYAEGFGAKSIGLTHFSVSTKFSEYLLSGKTILAAGAEELSAIRYLKRENAAVVAARTDAFESAVKECMQCDERYIQNALKCAKRDFDKEKIQAMIKADVMSLVGKRGDTP